MRRDFRLFLALQETEGHYGGIGDMAVLLNILPVRKPLDKQIGNGLPQ